MDNGQSLNKLLEFDNFVLSFQEPGLGQDACVEAYDKDDAVKHYAVSTVALAYRGPQYCADMAAAMVQDRREGALVLDVAAGTGLVGEELHKHGFKNIHALDGASQMLETCKQKGVYSDFIQCILLEGKQMPIANATYDVVAMSGATIENHLPPSSMQEFVRVIKPGGYFINCYRATIQDIEYGKEWLAEAARLEKTGKWKLYGRLNFRKYHVFSDGFVDIYQVN
ncbi:methyltransferase-like protein 27 [Physella acuta]|uniref:methyltransferase-like protein 27 n=1 Tax=Physella acuta TaxID=109671 RepID=UPI0027DC3F1A|nr:methyltransferase-like protein 27 [Physella acuta]